MIGYENFFVEDDAFGRRQLIFRQGVRIVGARGYGEAPRLIGQQRTIFQTRLSGNRIS